MRIHALRMQGFGPFSGIETVNFDALSTEGLFIVTGPTGSGKTTVLDAICFALYGQTTGEGQASGLQDGRSGTELRCTRCEPGQTTEVELDFSVGENRFRIVRNPAYERAKERGAGMTKEAASATLHARDAASGEWSLRASGRIGAVNAEIERIVGLTAEQFRRVIVIPQGRFREVLVSEHGERQDLLQRIFDTGTYEMFEKLVDERSRAADTAMRDIANRQQRLVERHAFLQQVELPRLETVVDEHLAAASDEADRAKASLDACEATRDAAMRAHAEAKELATQVMALQRARGALAKALESVESSTAARAERERAERAAAAMAAIERHDRARTACTEAESAATRAREAVGVADGKAKAAEAASKAAADAAAPVPTMTERIGSLRASRTAAVAAATQRDAKSKVLQKARKAHADAQAARESAVQAVATRSAELQSARAACDVVRAAYLRGTAARLAERLEPGCACPVCGSAEHPHRAMPEPNAPSSEALEAAEAEVHSSVKSHGEAQARAAGAEQAAQSAAAAVKQHESEIAAMPPADDIGVIDEQLVELEKEIGRLRQAESAARDAHVVASRGLQDARMASERADEAHKQSKQQTVESAAALQAAVQASGFPDEAAVRVHARPEATVKAWQSTHRHQDEAVSNARVAVATIETQVAGRAMPDMPTLEAALAEANRLRAEADRKHEGAREARRVLVEAKRDTGLLVRDGAEAEREQRMLSGLRKAVMGDVPGGDRVTLHAWVLGAVLEEVVHVATRTVKQLTRGRYELVRAESPTDARSRAGLEIEVFDSHTGTRRAARTLSGGETFLASLSLALALAEVAEARQGGRRLETVFIDEGFGTLDSETLDLAMDALSAMCRQGRVVGVISHVEEMKRQIPVQLQVLRDEATGGSSTRVTGGCAAGGRGVSPQKPA